MIVKTRPQRACFGKNAAPLRAFEQQQEPRRFYGARGNGHTGRLCLKRMPCRALRFQAGNPTFCHTDLGDRGMHPDCEPRVIEDRLPIDRAGRTPLKFWPFRPSRQKWGQGRLQFAGDFITARTDAKIVFDRCQIRVQLSRFNTPAPMPTAGVWREIRFKIGQQRPSPAGRCAAEPAKTPFGSAAIILRRQFDGI